MGYENNLIHEMKIKEKAAKTAEITTDKKAAQAPRVNGSLPGVNVCGYLRNESGLGAAARGYIRALEFLGVPVSLKDLSHLSVNRSEDNSLSGLDRGPVHDVSVFCVNADQHFRIMDELGMEFFRHRYNIGIWAWELPRFPEEWYDCFAYYNEIWVASSFIANALAPVSPIPIVRIPPVLNRPSVGSRLHGRRHLGVNSKELVYLFVFDFHSYFERKNPLALIRAFKKAFRASQPVRLVIKCVNQGSNKDGFAAMKEESRGHRISIHSGYWRADELQDLMAACDVYVSLHRSEGTGLTISDAMALGKPVIATNWSGNTDFMDESNSYPVRYKLVRLTKNHGPYHKGEIWAEPSIDHAAELMRFVYEHPEEARKRGKAAAKQIQTKFSEQRVAGLIKDRLALIARQGGVPSSQAAAGPSARLLIPRTLNTVNPTAPVGAIVAAVNGDGDAVQRSAVRTPEVSLATLEGDTIEAFAIDSPTSASQMTGEEIVIEGWVLGRNSAVVAVELIGRTATLKRVPVQMRRRDVSVAHPHVPWAETSGFRAAISALEMAEAVGVRLNAIMNDNTSIPLGVVRAIPPARTEVRPGGGEVAILPAQSPDQALRQELADLRQLAIGTLEVSQTAPDRQRVAAFAIDAPASRCQVTAEEIVVNGWVVGRKSAVVAVELVGPIATLKRVPVQIERSDIAAEHPQIPWAETSGFRTTIRALEMAQASCVELRDSPRWQQFPPWDDPCRPRGWVRRASRRSRSRGGQDIQTPQGGGGQGVQTPQGGGGRVNTRGKVAGEAPPPR